MAILKSTYESDSFSVNHLTYNITVTVDEEITTTNVNDVLPNNGNHYKTISGVNFVATGSSATIYTPSAMIVANFIAENGTVNADTGYQDGTWKILASVPFK